MSRLTNDIDAINQAVSQNVVSLLASVLSMVGILVAMFVLNVWLALAAVVVVPIMLWFTDFVARYTRKGFRDLQKSLGSLNGVMEEVISGQRVVKAFRRNDSAIEAFRERNQEVYRSAVYANSYALLLMPLTNQLGNLFVIVIAGLGGWLALKDLVTVGTIVTFISYGRNFINPLRQLANMYNSIQAALAGAERVFEIIDTPSEIDDAPEAAPPDKAQGHVTFENVQFSYTPEKPIIKNMTLEAKPGETVALVGPTGAGKTTLVNLLTRFYEIDAGRISIDGTDIRQIKKDDLRRELGLVLQDTFLFSASVMENIRYGRLEATDEEVIEAARNGGCRPFHPENAARLPDHAFGTGQQSEPGPAADAVHRARHPGRPLDPDPGRGHQQRGHAHRSPHPECAPAPDEGPHQFCHRPPPEHHPGCRSVAGDQGW